MKNFNNITNIFSMIQYLLHVVFFIFFLSLVSPALNIDDERPVNVPGTNQYVRRSGRRKSMNHFKIEM